MSPEDKVRIVEEARALMNKLAEENKNLKFALDRVVNDTKYGPLLSDGTIALARHLRGYKPE